MNSGSSTQCTCVYTAASLTTHDMTTLPTLIWTCKFDITLKARIASSPGSALATLRDSPKVHVVTLAAVSETHLLSDSIDFPRRTGNISPWVRLVISDSLHAGLTSCQKLRSLGKESACDVGIAPACDSNFQCHLCGDWFSSSKGEVRTWGAKHAIVSVGKLFASGCGCCPCCKVTSCSRPRLLVHLTDLGETKCLESCTSNAYSRGLQ